MAFRHRNGIMLFILDVGDEHIVYAKDRDILLWDNTGNWIDRNWVFLEEWERSFERVC